MLQTDHNAKEHDAANDATNQDIPDTPPHNTQQTVAQLVTDDDATNSKQAAGAVVDFVAVLVDAVALVDFVAAVHIVRVVVGSAVSIDAVFAVLLLLTVLLSLCSVLLAPLMSRSSILPAVHL